MGINSRASRKTQVFFANITVFATFTAATIAPASLAGTIGTAEAETARLRDEVTAARNALDAEILKPGVKLTDPSVQAKRADLDAKVKAYQKGFQDALKATPAKNTAPVLQPDEIDTDDHPGTEASSPNAGHPRPAPPLPAPAPAPAAPTEPEMVLSGDGVQSEITYPKKPSPGKTARPIPRLSPKTHVEEPVPESTAKADAAGLSEIHYPKKKSAD